MITIFNPLLYYHKYPIFRAFQNFFVISWRLIFCTCDDRNDTSLNVWHSLFGKENKYFCVPGYVFFCDLSRKFPEIIQINRRMKYFIFRLLWTSWPFFFSSLSNPVLLIIILAYLYKTGIILYITSFHI